MKIKLFNERTGSNGSHPPDRYIASNRHGRRLLVWTECLESSRDLEPTYIWIERIFSTRYVKRMRKFQKKLRLNMIICFIKQFVLTNSFNKRATCCRTIALQDLGWPTVELQFCPSKKLYFRHNKLRRFFFLLKI